MEFNSTNNKLIEVDDEDFERVNKYSWYVNTRNYVHTRIDGNEVLLHRFILNISGDILVDHKDHNTLNNKKLNLRPATKSQNQQNRKKSSGSSSKYKGVGWNKHAKKWRTSIRLPTSGQQILLGYFTCEIEAARAYNAAAIKHFGEFAYINTLD